MIIRYQPPTSPWRGLFDDPIYALHVSERDRDPAEWDRLDRETEEQARCATTLPEYYTACLYAHQDAPDDAGPTLAVVRRYQRRYGDDVLECAPAVLRHTMRGYRPIKLTGPDPFVFAALFERNLREHLRKKRARAAKKEAREREARAAYRPHQTHEAEAVYRRWTDLLWDLVVVRLGPEVGTGVQLVRDRASIKTIAEKLHWPAKTVRNRLSKAKVAALVRTEVRALVEELPHTYRDFLVRHLLHEVGLTPARVERLLGVPAMVGPGRLLEEHELLDVLGWR
jgi:hypothetical protein